MGREERARTVSHVPGLFLDYLWCWCRCEKGGPTLQPEGEEGGCLGKE